MNTEGWKHFKMDELFTSFERGKVHSQYNLPDGDDYFYVGAKKDRCGVMRLCGYDEDLISRGNCIVFICNGEGSVGYCNYMDRDFMASGDLILAYGDFINPYTALFIVALLDRERPKYSFGRKYGKYVAKTTIPLPIQEDGKTPDWDWIEKHTKEDLLPSLPTSARRVWLKQYDILPIHTKKKNKAKRKLLTDCTWEYFRYDEIFDIRKGFYNKKPDDIECGDIPFIGATDSNNGVTSRCNYDVIEQASKTGDENNAPIEEKIFDGKCITVSSNGSVGYAFYQPVKFTCSHDVNPLYIHSQWGKELNPYIAVFICTIIEKERFRWAYGRKWRPMRMPSSIIRLPVISGTRIPDWQFMEDYIKSLPYSKNI